MKPLKLTALRLTGIAAALMLAGLGGAPAHACEGMCAAGCDVFAWPLDEEKALFHGSLPTVAPGEGAGAFGAEPGLILKLMPQAEVDFDLPPEKTEKQVPEKPLGGIFAFGAPAEAGVYQVTLSAGAWMDLIQGGKVLPSVAHTGAKSCEGLRKSVRFKLKAAPVTLQVSGAADAAVKIAIRKVD